MNGDDERLGRRELLAGAVGAAAALALGCERRSPPPSSPTESRSERRSESSVTERLPTIYVPHGGGPWPFVDLGARSSGYDGLREYLTGLPATLPARPKALLVTSAHWEERVPTLMTSARPPMLYDYYGFPPESYEIQWPAPGAPDVAEEVRALLSDAGIENGEDDSRGFDHGTFVVTKLMYPSEPYVPTFQLSLTDDLDPERTLRIGRALAPLRDRGVLILGSGFSYHNMRGFGAATRGDPAPIEASRAFDDWLAETVALEASARDARLAEWASAPRARECHPREEHLLPLMVCAGAALEDRATTPFRDAVMGVRTLAAHFG
jgi:aromatic ring-opening dioxygenase catalytic subunit (LigB family)